MMPNPVTASNGLTDFHNDWRRWIWLREIDYKASFHVWYTSPNILSLNIILLAFTWLKMYYGMYDNPKIPNIMWQKFQNFGISLIDRIRTMMKQTVHFTNVV